MQTFLPYADFKQSAKVLDRARLGKQRVETKQIYLALTKGSHWINHPAVQQWKGYEVALLTYGCIVCQEWIQRGYKDSLLSYFKEELRNYFNLVMPSWLGDANYHFSHRANLLRKYPEWYQKFFKNEFDNVDYNSIMYVWPSKQ